MSLSKLSAVILATLILQSCSRDNAAPLRIGINPWPGYEFIYLAQEKGFFRDAGVNIRIIELNSLSDARRAYERGQIDGMGTTVIEVLQARDQSPRLPQIVYAVDYSDGADVILAQPNIKTGEELRGKRIGVELASLGVFVLARGLAKYGLTITDIVPKSMDQITMEQAFRQQDLDAIVTYPPTSIKMSRDTKAMPLFSSAEIPGEVVDVIAIEQEIAQKRADDVRKMLLAFERAIAYAAQNPTDAHRIMAAREGITPEEFATALKDGVRILGPTEQAEFFRPGGKLFSVLDSADRVLRETGQITGADRRDGSINGTFVSHTTEN